MMRDAEKTIGNLIDKQGGSFIASISEDGFPNMKAMLPPRKRVGIQEIYFTTNTSSMRVAQYRKNPNASIYFCDKRFFRGVMLVGHMEVLEDSTSKEMIWREGDTMYYPGGVTNPDYCVLKFVAERGRYYASFHSESFEVGGDECIEMTRRTKTMSEKYTFQDFLASIDGENQKFVSDLHDELTVLGCKVDVKSAKSGFVVSYSLNKKTIANYVFRKKGLIARIYAGHIAQYMELLDTLPDGMVRSIKEAPICKRLVDPAACNQKCSMGYDFILKGERLQRCRNNAFMFLLDEESRPFVKSLLLREVKAAV